MLLDDSPLPATNTTRAGSVIGEPLPVLDEEPSQDGPRYGEPTLIGQGGQGEVLVCRDRVTGRDVAMKVLRPCHADLPASRARFLREARIQAQLEHPAIVPVYDLGIGPDGNRYFTMRRVRGVSLAEVIARLARGEPDALRTYTRRRLLGAFDTLCLAIDFAHRQGFLHLDLKPANVMLGDFGEVYVLDWGLARPDAPATNDTEPAAPARRGEGAPPPGTPAYMSPELLSGGPAAVGSDVFALGAILFEILTCERLRRPGDAAAYDAHISARIPLADVAPELEAICLRATAPEPARRYPDARALHDDLTRYLEGDRNVTLRRELAQAHLASAIASARRAAAADDDVGERGLALRELGQALALDPTNRDAMATLLKLLASPPRVLPEEAREEMQRTQEQHQKRHQATTVAISAGLLVLALVLFAWVGVRSWALLLLGLAAAVVGDLFRGLAVRRRWSIRRAGLADIAASAIVLFLSTRLCGPFVIAPACAVIFGFYVLSPDRRVRLVGAVTGPAVLLGVIVLELVGVLPSSYAFEDGRIIILPQALDLPEVPSIVMLTAISLAIAITAVLCARRARISLTGSEHELRVQAWQLRQLVPEPPASVTRAVSH